MTDKVINDLLLSLFLKLLMPLNIFHAFHYKEIYNLASILHHEITNIFVLKYIKKIIKHLKSKI